MAIPDATDLDLAPAPTLPCDRYTPEATRLVVVGFLDAHNAGAPDITDRFIALVGQFQWYGAPGRQFPDADVSTDRGAIPCARILGFASPTPVTKTVATPSIVSRSSSCPLLRRGPGKVSWLKGVRIGVW